MQQTDKALCDFNAWWDRQPFRDQFEDMKQQMANVWVASRAEVVVELPPKISAYNTMDNGFVRPEAAEYDSAIDDCREAIEAAGLTVKE